MISHEHKFIYIHIPKSAGTSVEKSLVQYASESHGSGWAVGTKNWRNKELFNIIELHSSYYTFTFSRNPYSRVISMWRFFPTFKDLSLLEVVCKISEFLQTNPEKDYSAIPDNDTTFIGKRHPLPGSYPFSDKGNIGYHLLPETYFITDNVDFIGKVETLQQDFNTVCDRIGIPQQELPHHNKTRHKHYTEYYDDETRELVAKVYAKDIEYFGYKFGQ